MTAVEERSVDEAMFLAEAGRVLSSSLDYETTLAQVAQLVTPALADYCVIDILAADGSVRRVAAHHADPAQQEVLDQIRDKYPPRLGSPQPAMRAITTGEPELMIEAAPQGLAEHTVNREHFELVRRLGVRSYLAVPLLCAGHTLGAISLGFVGTRRYRASDVPLIDALAGRAAVAIQNALFYREAELARAEAEAANRAKDDFLAMLGHELRNPLAPIVSALDLLRLREGPSHERTVIERQVQHVRRLVDDLLDVAGIARGKLRLSSQPLDLNEAVQDGIELARPLIEERKHTLRISCCDEAPIMGDRTRLAQVISNLLSNAARYTEIGGTITLSTTCNEREVELRVRDNGIGISAELLPRIFDLFAQAAQPADRRRGGLGLGLSIVRSLVELHGGTVHAHSEGPGAGSELRVLLPALTRAAERPRLSGAAPAPHHTGTAVLIVDDNADAADLLAISLRTRGYETHVVYDPHGALELLASATVDVALLDIGLPGMDGHELARRIHATAAHAALPLIALTGYGQASDRARSKAAGFAEHLVKPADLTQVLSAIESLLANRPKEVLDKAR